MRSYGHVVRLSSSCTEGRLIIAYIGHLLMGDVERTVSLLTFISKGELLQRLSDGDVVVDEVLG